MPLSAEQFVAPAIHKGLAWLWICIWNRGPQKCPDCREGHNLFDRTMEMPQLDETSWRNMEDGWGWSLDGFWMFSGQHLIVASIQILVTQISKLLIAHRGFLASEINNLTRQKSPSHRFHRAVTNALCWLYQIAEPDHRIRKVRWSDLWLGVQVKDCLSEV